MLLLFYEKLELFLVFGILTTVFNINILLHKEILPTHCVKHVSGLQT